MSQVWFGSCTFDIGVARLFDGEPEIRARVGNLDDLFDRPPAVDINEHIDVRSDDVGDGSDRVDVLVDVSAPGLELQFRVALRLQVMRRRRSLVCGSDTYDVVRGYRVGLRAPEQITNSGSIGLACQVPTRDVDHGFGLGRAIHGTIDGATHKTDLAGIDPDEAWSYQFQRGANRERVRGLIARTGGASLTPASESGVRHDLEDRAVRVADGRGRHRVVANPRQRMRVRADFGDLHTPMLSRVGDDWIAEQVLASGHVELARSDQGQWPAPTPVVR